MDEIGLEESRVSCDSSYGGRFARAGANGGRKSHLITYQNADDGNQKDDFHQAVKDKEEAAEHVSDGIDLRGSRLTDRTEECEKKV